MEQTLDALLDRSSKLVLFHGVLTPPEEVCLGDLSLRVLKTG